MTEDEYYEWFSGYGFRRTGEGTDVAEEWVHEDGTAIFVTRPSELSPGDRLAAVERFRRALGIGYPIGGGGAH